MKDQQTKTKHAILIPFEQAMENGLRKLKKETGLSIAAIVRLAVKEYLAKK